MDDIIDQAAEGTLPQQEAGLYFQLLQDGKLMEHRRKQKLSVQNNEKAPSGVSTVPTSQQEVQKPQPGVSQPASAGDSSSSSTGSSGSSNSKR